MATLDLSKAKTSFYMDDPNLVSFGSLDGAADLNHLAATSRRRATGSP